MKKFKIQNLNIEQISREAQRKIQGGSTCYPGCYDFFTSQAGKEVEEGDLCEPGIFYAGCYGTIQNGQCCV